MVFYIKKAARCAQAARHARNCRTCFFTKTLCVLCAFAVQFSLICLIFAFIIHHKKIGVDLKFRSQSLLGSLKNRGAHISVNSCLKFS